MKYLIERLLQSESHIVGDWYPNMKFVNNIIALATWKIIYANLLGVSKGEHHIS